MGGRHYFPLNISVISTTTSSSSVYLQTKNTASYRAAMATEEGNNSKLHVVMFPWLAFGHMIPFLELSKHIASRGHTVSFISDRRNIDRLPKLPPHLSSLITFVHLPLPPQKHLPENAAATSDLPYDQVKYLKLAYDGLRDPIAKFLQNSSPDWVLFDFASYWIPSVASELGIPTAFFSIFTASAITYLVGRLEDVKLRTKPEDFVVPPPWVPFESTVALKLFEIMKIVDVAEEDDDGVSDLVRASRGAEHCDALAVRGFVEFEPEWFELLKDIHRKPVFPVGQLPTTDHGDGGASWPETKAWLDRQAAGSVVYVAFGSEAKPSQLELTDIALGLERSGFPFFWVLRTRRGEADTESTRLPDGFEERTRGRGIVCTSWAPQLKILSHDSVGGFLTHSGWSSVVEAVQLEKPLVLLTFLADQGLNARVLEEKKMGYSIPRDERDGRFTSESVAESLKLVMVGEEGKIYREKIKEMKGLFCDKGKQDGAVDDLLNYLQSHKQKKKKKKKIREIELN